LDGIVEPASTETVTPQNIVVIGHTDVGRRVCALLAGTGVSTNHLDAPTDAELRDALRGDVDGVAVLLHDDIRALRYCLVVAHIRPGIRLFVAMFDATARAQLENAVPNCVVLSPAAIAVPSMAAAAIAPTHACVRRETSSKARTWVTIDAEPGIDQARIHAYEPPLRLRLRGLLGVLRGQFRPYDAGSTVLLGGAFGLLAVIVVDTLVGIQHESLVRSLYDATRTTATIAAPEVADETGVLLWAPIAALLVELFPWTVRLVVAVAIGIRLDRRYGRRHAPAATRPAP